MASTTQVPLGVPAWGWNILQGLSAKGQLFGVPPEVMAAEWRSQNGGAFPVQQLSSAGDGLFGLGANTYDTPAGARTISNALLTGNNQQNFATLASIGAGRIATLAEASGGNLQQGIATYDDWGGGGISGEDSSSASTLSLLSAAGYSVPSTGFKASGGPGTPLPSGTGAPGAPGAPGSSSGTVNSSGASTSGNSVLGNCSGCLVSVPLVGGCMFSRCNAKAIIGGLLVAAGGLGVVVGIAVMVKSDFGIGALGKALSASQGAGRAATPAASSASTPAQDAAEPFEQVREPEVPELDDADLDRELQAYYLGVQAGQDAPRRPRKQVGVLHDADEGEF